MKATIGIEVHAELKTETKMFCGCRNAPHDAEPNMHVCPICMAHPGTLPTINKAAVRHVLRVGHAIGGSAATFTEFDRKNYFYPDIPKGYQISQYQYPLVRGGELAGVAITRVHLEEDTARSSHDGDKTLIDHNRAGVPLMELVTEPVIHDAKTAGHFARELQLLLRTLGASDANMERGEMRVEANISISENDTLGTKVEVKNLNSFRAVEQAIEHEIERQHALYIREEQVVQETRGWDENRGITYSQRLKETAEDYRYFPDPDLPKLEIPLESDFSRLAETLPELPQKWREKYTYLGLPREQIEILVYNEELRTFFERVVGHEENMEMAQRAANYITSDVQALIVSDDTFTWDDTAIECFRKLMDMLMREVISSRVAKDLLKETLSGSDPELLAAERGLLKEKNTEVLEVLALGIITEHASVVAEYRSGKEGALQFLVGQGMKVTKGAADPELLRQIIQKKISDGDQ